MPTDNSEQQVVEMTWRGSKVTAQTLAKIISAALRLRYTSANKVVRGSQNLKKLNRHNRELGVVTITDKDIGVFKKALRQQRVDFSIKRDLKSGKYHFYFKAQDSERIYEGLKQCVGKLTPKKLSKTTLTALLSAFQKRAAAQQQNKSPSKEKSKGKDGHEK